MEMRRIVVFVDLSPVAAEALSISRRLATAFGAELDLLRVVEDPLAAGWTTELSASALPQVQDAMQVETEEWLSGVVEDPDGLQATLDMEIGVAEDEILKYAQRRAADLIVIGDEAGGDADEDRRRIVDAVAKGARSAVLVVRKAAWLAEPDVVQQEAARNEADPAPDDEISYDGPAPEDEAQ
jgi:nucleotide-binding universal stress UspA family protein